jgi:Protein of unknown function (DUF2750)
MMSWRMHQKEFDAVGFLPAPDRYGYLIKKVADWKTLWGLKGKAGWALSGTDEGQELVPVWPHERFAQACATGSWAEYEPHSIDLSDWLENWTPRLLNDGRGVAVFVTSTSAGIAVSPNRLRTDLQDELSEYEED